MHGIVASPCIRLALASSRASLCTAKFSTYSPRINPLTRRFSSTTPHPASISSLTGPQISRTVARAIRAAVKEGRPREAVNVTHSVLSLGNHARTRPFQSSTGIKSIAIKQHLPSRLASHALVHALLREGLFMDAAAEIRRMIAHGHRFHSRTISTTVGLLCNPTAPLREVHISPNRPTEEYTARLDDLDTARLLSAESSRLPPGPRQAFGILMTSRQYRRERTQGMFGRLVDACLLQGEILIATLLFVLMVKDWQVRNVVRASKRQIEACLDQNTDEAEVEHTEKQLVSLGFPNSEIAKHLKFYCRSFVPVPPKSVLGKILDHLEHHALTSNTTDRCRKEAIESMLLLAELLREGSLPWGNVGRLLRVLQNCPRSPGLKAGIQRNGEYLDVNVYEEVHNILQELCLRPPDDQNKPTLDSPRIMPPLDIPAYNALLRYSLRHRLSPALANSVLHHMSNRRQPSLNPNIQTYNTLLRSSTLVNKNDIAAEIVQQLGRRPENSQHLITHSDVDGNLPVDLHVPTKRERRELSGYIPKFRRQIKEQDLHIPPLDPSQEYVADKCTLASYITHLVAIGRPDAAEELVFKLFPELDLPPPDTYVSEADRREQRDRCIVRGVEYGPYIFSTLLNALCKAGRTGLVERVWHLAKQAERASWELVDRGDQHTPWTLPIHAYTSVLQCYANESRKGLMLIRGSIHEPRTLQNQTQARGRIYVQGWAYYILRTQAREQGFLSPESSLRREAARKSGLLLYKTMQQEAMSVWHGLKQGKDAVPLLNSQAPVPDEYFFNTLLDIFGRQPYMQARRRSGRNSHWQRKLRITNRNYARYGLVCKSYNPALVQLAKDMAAYGYQLPIGFQRVLVGHGPHIVRKNTPKRVKVVPYAYPPYKPKGNQVFSLAVVKERGLPLYDNSKPPKIKKPKRHRVLETRA